jgi:hypothetical protein
MLNSGFTSGENGRGILSMRSKQQFPSWEGVFQLPMEVIKASQAWDQALRLIWD